MEDPVPVVKPALKTGNKSKSKTKDKDAHLKWDEEKIKEHDKERGTRMKIDEPDTPYHHNYDSGSETDGSHRSHERNEKKGALDMTHLQNKLDAHVAAKAQVCPNSPGASLGSADEEERAKELKALEFKEHRKRHYNEMEMVRRFRMQHANDDDDDDDGDNDADDEA